MFVVHTDSFVSSAMVYEAFTFCEKTMKTVFKYTGMDESTCNGDFVDVHHRQILGRNYKGGNLV